MTILVDSALYINHKRIGNFIVQALFAVVENDHDVAYVYDKGRYVFREIAQ